MMTTVPSPRHRLTRFRRFREVLVERKPDRDRGIARWVPWAIALLAIAVLIAGFFVTQKTVATQTSNDTLTGQRDATAQQANTLADQVAAACAAGGDTAADLQRVGACRQAAQVQADPTPVAGPQGDPGPGPTDAQINAAVANWLFLHPPPAGRTPSVADIAAAVTDYLTTNPPQPGRAPTAAEIATAVAGWFADHPVRNGTDGVDGKDGQPGRPPTAEEIQTAVAAELAANPPPAGPPGPSGPTCPAQTTLATVTYADGRTGQGCVSDVQPTPPPPLIGN